jgi:hypothetical protein
MARPSLVFLRVDTTMLHPRFPALKMDRVIKYLDSKVDEFTEELMEVNPGVIPRLEERASLPPQCTMCRRPPATLTRISLTDRLGAARRRGGKGSGTYSGAGRAGAAASVGSNGGRGATSQ